MNNREIKIKTISDYFTRIELCVRNLNHQNLNDFNVVTEVLIGKIFNLVYGYNLKTSSLISSTFPCVDLIDMDNRVSVQVTSDKSEKKIQKTIDCYYSNKLYENYDHLIVFIVGERQKSYYNLVVPSEISFDPKEDIIDFKLLLRFVSNLNLDKMNKIINVLRSESTDYIEKPIRPQSSRVRFKQIQAIKKRIEKELLKDLKLEDWRECGELFEFEPRFKFIYRSLNIRSIDDNSYPEFPTVKVDT